VSTVWRLTVSGFQEHRRCCYDTYLSTLILLRCSLPESFDIQHVIALSPSSCHELCILLSMTLCYGQCPGQTRTGTRATVVGGDRQTSEHRSKEKKKVVEPRKQSARDVMDTAYRRINKFRLHLEGERRNVCIVMGVCCQGSLMTGKGKNQDMFVMPDSVQKS
jgi:hypothetical protein